MDRFLMRCCTILVITIGRAQGICTWPGSFSNTVWRDGVQGDLSFTSQTMSGWDLVVRGITITSWQCHSTDWFESHSYLILRSAEQFQVFDMDYYVYLCLYTIPITGDSFRYYIYNPQEYSLGNYGLLVDTSADLQDFNRLCSNSSALLALRPSVSEYRVMIKSGSEAAAKINCPYLFLGNYDYTHTDSTGSETCAGSTDTMDTCTDFSEMSFSYNTCSTLIAYSTSNTVWCVDSVPVNDNTYVTIYNGNDNSVDGTTTFRFSCIAISGDGTSASVSPNNCKKDQTPDALPSGSPAATLELTKTGSCESCPRLSAPDGGNVTYSTDGAVTTATYQCSEQYSLAGSSTRECQADLTWTLEAHICTVTSSFTSSTSTSTGTTVTTSGTTKPTSGTTSTTLETTTTTPVTTTTTPVTTTTTPVSTTTTPATTTTTPKTKTTTPVTTTPKPVTTTTTVEPTTTTPETTTPKPVTTTNQPGTTTATPETTSTQTKTTTSTCETTTTPTGTSTSTSETKCTTTSQPVTETTCTCTSVTKTTTPTP